MKAFRKLILLPILCYFALCNVILPMGAINIGPTFASASSASKIARSVKSLALAPSSVSHYFYDQLGTGDLTDLDDDAKQKAIENANMRKNLYHAMEDMYNDGIFIKGEDYDLVANNRVTEAQLQAYAEGDDSLLDAMGAARDAFYTDYAEIFYVDFSYLSFRVTQDGAGKYHAYMGNGRSDTYYVPGFTNAESVNSAISEYNEAKNAVVAIARSAQPTDDQIKELGEPLAKTVAQIREAHKQIALSTKYRLETKCTPGNEGHVRTPYGVFVKGESLCEGYSRAFKAVMDALGVPCVLINGGYKHSETRTELHMWTYVELEIENSKEWYAVDPTFDDVNGKPAPITPSGITNPLDYEYTEDYFLKGAALMDTQHLTSPYKSGAQYPFSYPNLAPHNFGSEISTAHGLFNIVQVAHDANMDSTDIYVSVFIDDEWYGQEEAAKKGYYLLMRHEGNYLPDKLVGKSDLSHVGDDDYVSGGNNMTWGYLYNDSFPEGEKMLYANLEDHTGYTIIKDESKSTGFEFALTDVAPADYEDTDDIDKIARMYTFCGDPTAFIAQSGVVRTKYGDPDYQPAPFIVTSTPSIQGMLYVGKTYNVKVEYDQLLELDGDELEFSIYGMRATGEILKGTNAVTNDCCWETSKYYLVTDLEYYSGKLNTNGEGLAERSYISFKFTPSKMFAHDNIMYFFNFNLKGVNSGKRVNPISYVAANSTGYCSLGIPGYNWRVFGQPELLEDGDLSMNGWKTSDGTPVGELEAMKSRLALVVTAPTKQQESDMNSKIADKLGGDVNYNMSADGESSFTASGDKEVQSFTFNLSLALCKCMIVQTGEAIRVSVGFPEGFTYTDALEGVVFKAYHFIHDAQNNIVDVEEISCTVTQYGLIIQCNSFSPFAIVAVKGETPTETTGKTVIISNSIGGTSYARVEGADNTNLFTLNDGENATLTVKANTGYVIESIKINNHIVTTSLTEMTMNIKYADLLEPEKENIIEVNFVPKTVQQSEAEKGQTSVVLEAKKQGVSSETVSATAKITNSQTTLSVKRGEEIVITPDVDIPNDGKTYTYQWYKDGVALEGQTNKILTIQDANKYSSGNYTLRVTTTIGPSTFYVESSAIKVTVDAGPSSLGTIFTIVGIALAAVILVFVLLSLILKRNKTRKSR